MTLGGIHFNLFDLGLKNSDFRGNAPLKQGEQQDRLCRQICSFGQLNKTQEGAILTKVSQSKQHQSKADEIKLSGFVYMYTTLLLVPFSSIFSSNTDCLRGKLLVVACVMWTVQQEPMLEYNNNFNS